MDLSGSGGSVALELSHATDGDPRPIHSHTVFDCHPDAAPAYLNRDANANIYTHPFPHFHARAGRLPEAAG
jgi:hypothetical protein